MEKNSRDPPTALRAPRIPPQHKHAEPALLSPTAPARPAVKHLGVRQAPIARSGSHPTSGQPRLRLLPSSTAWGEGVHPNPLKSRRSSRSKPLGPQMGRVAARGQSYNDIQAGSSALPQRPCYDLPLNLIRGKVVRDHHQKVQPNQNPLNKVQVVHRGEVDGHCRTR